MHTYAKNDVTFWVIIEQFLYCRQLFSNNHISVELLFNYTEKDPTFTVTGFCPGGVYLFRIAAVNNYGLATEFDEGVFAVIQEESCLNLPPRECFE